MNSSRHNSDFLRVGVIGCGKMSKNHVKAISLASGASIVAAADPAIIDGVLPDWFGDEVEHFETSEQMLTSTELDVVHIITPPSTHFPIAKSALEKGVNVYVEKPFTSSVAEAEKLLDLAQEKGLKIVTGHQLLFTRPAALLRDSLESIGRVVHIESYFSFNTVRRGISPLDQLIDILPHPTYLLYEFFDQSRQDNGAAIEIDKMTATHDGEVRGLLRAGNISGSLVISLSGRPVDSYVKVIGTNGSLHADFVRGYVVKSQGPGTSVFSVLLIPYVQAIQLFFKITGAIFRLFSDRKKGYPGLPELVSTFYASINQSGPDPVSRASVMSTVAVCEAARDSAAEAAENFEEGAASDLKDKAAALAPIEPGKGRVLITGGTGLFGRPTAALLRNSGWPVTVLSRKAPPASKREPGVEYVEADLGDPVPAPLLDGVETIIHAAAETAGGKAEQERNSIQATRLLLDAAEKSGIKKFIHISSIAVLKPGSESGSKALDESSPVDLDNLSRGPYVWGKAESENLAANFGDKTDMEVKIVRLGPLVDYENYRPPGRLGREIHNLFVAMGSSKEQLSVCSVQTAAQVMLAYVDQFSGVPDVLNLVEPDAPTRKELMNRWKEVRKPLRTIWIPSFVLSILSAILVMLQKIFLRGRPPINVKSAFSTEQYDSSKAAAVIQNRASS